MRFLLSLRQRSFASCSSLPVGQAASCLNTYATCSTLVYTACSLSWPSTSRLAASPPRYAVSSARRACLPLKPADGVRPISIGEVLYRLVSRAMYIQLRTAFHDHFVPHQLSMATPANAETLIHALWAALDVHLDWAVF